MEQDTNKLLETRSTYRIVDASYRIHSRLYKIHYALVHTEKTIFALFKNNIVTSGGVVITTIIGFTALYVQIAKITLSPESFLTLIVVILVLLLAYGYQYYQARKTEKELGKISSELKGEPLETWPSYLWDEAAKYSTRILMVKEILDENEKIHPNKHEESYILIKKTYADILEYSINELKRIKNECETCIAKTPDYKDYEETIKMCDELIKIGGK